MNVYIYLFRLCRVMERNPIYIQAAADYLQQKNVGINVVTTWDDWTEVQFSL